MLVFSILSSTIFALFVHQIVAIKHHIVPVAIHQVDTSLQSTNGTFSNFALVFFGQLVASVTQKNGKDTLEVSTRFEHFPLKMANAFIPDQTVAFTGDIDGGLYIYGSLDKPQMYGDIVLDSVSVYARQAGARYWFDNRPVQIKDNQLIFDKFAIYTTSKNPFTIDGKVDFRNMERPTANLNLLAENYTLLDAPRTRESLVYGKAPYYLIDEQLLEKNLKILYTVKERTGCKILLAQKCFSMFSVYPLIAEYLDGTTASGLYEAKLGYEEMHKENHVFSTAYRDDEIEEIMNICDHVVFNSFNQWQKYQNLAKQTSTSCGIRINPECSTQIGHEIYDPCAKFSRMGVTLENFKEELLEGIEGLHFHTLCEQISDDLITTIRAVEEKFGKYLGQMKWLNFGGCWQRF